MKKRSVICMLLALAMALSFAACGAVPPAPAESAAPAADTEPGAATPAPIPVVTPEAQTEHQADPKIQAIFNSLPALQQGGEREWRYAVTDLDHNGLLELVAASQHQADRSTTLKVWELAEDLSALYEY